ncbi:hypothetical protein J6590_006564 [Homalodisca vitripennis]|nr:hypothetical protein J6590_006564 [Homalodisca vitripennis]
MDADSTLCPDQVRGRRRGAGVFCGKSEEEQSGREGGWGVGGLRHGYDLLGDVVLISYSKYINHPLSLPIAT